MIFERRNLNLSIVMHVLLLLIAAFGLPVLLPDRPDPEPLVMTVEVLPISEMTNVKPSDKPIQKAQKAPTPPTPKVDPKPPTPKAPKPTPDTKEEPMEKPFDPMAEAEPVKEKPPEPKKEPVKEDKKDEDFMKTLENLAKEAEKSEKNAKDTSTVEENKTKSDAPYDASQPMSLSEKDAIRNQFIPCWSPPMGAKDAKDLIVRLQAQYKPDGSLIDVRLADDLKGRYASDTFFRAAADAALRGVRNPRCNPLKNLSADKYGTWRDMELTFDPQLYY